MNDAAQRAGIWLMDAPETLETSRELCLRCAQGHGLVVRHAFISRPERFGRSRVFADLRQKLDEGEISVVVVATLSELARSVPELRDIVDVLAASNCRLIVASEGLDSSAPGIGEMAALVTALIRWRPFLTGQIVAASTVTPGRAATQPVNMTPFGYRWREGVLEADPLEAPIRAMVFDLFAERGRSSEVAAVLNASGARRRDRNRFSPRDIQRIIRDPIAKGVYRGNRRTPEPRMRTHGDEPGALVSVFPIVSDELWELCNRKLDARPRPDD